MTHLDEMNALLQSQEELDPELAAYMDENETFGTCIRHPLVYSMCHFPQLNAMVNRQLQGKRELLAEAEASGDWHSYIYLHERPYRIEGFQEVMDQMSDAQYWYNLAGIWMDSENIRQNPRIWQELLKSDRPMRSCMMNDDAHLELAAMDDVIPVYQGHTARRHDGWSWTIDRDKAVWFAQRFAMMEKSQPVLTEGTVAKSHVIAYLTGRGEKEILADRRYVRNRTVTPLEKKDDY